MSFSSEVKAELLAQIGSARHCQLAELAGMLSGAGRLHMQDQKQQLIFTTENEQSLNKYVRLLSMIGDRLAADVRVQCVCQKNKTLYLAEIQTSEAVQQIFLSLKIPWTNSTLQAQNHLFADGLLLQKRCCKRAFLRGFFLTAGSISDPRKSYHFEIVCTDVQKAKQVQSQLQSFSLEAKTVSRKNHEIVYLKEGAQIVDALNIMGAHTALMDLENVRILKEMRNDINRRVNCETANINKTVNAAYRQQEAIRLLQQQGILQGLPHQLQEIAGLRMEHPEATIQELGTMCSPPVGKSGVNHRLRKLEELAGEMQEKG